MPTRKEFRGVANDMVDSFVSRNNDVGGYWAMGKLYKHAKDRKTGTVFVDFKNGEIAPPSLEYQHMAEHHMSVLRWQMYARNMPPYWIKKARAFVSFYPTFAGSSLHLAHGYDAYVCVLEIKSDMGRTYSATRRGRCWPHDPTKEHKSAQA